MTNSDQAQKQQSEIPQVPQDFHQLSRNNGKKYKITGFHFFIFNPQKTIKTFLFRQAPFSCIHYLLYYYSASFVLLYMHLGLKMSFFIAHVFCITSWYSEFIIVYALKFSFFCHHLNYLCQGINPCTFAHAMYHCFCSFYKLLQIMNVHIHTFNNLFTPSICTPAQVILTSNTRNVISKL